MTALLLLQQLLLRVSWIVEAYAAGHDWTGIGSPSNRRTFALLRRKVLDRSTTGYDRSRLVMLLHAFRNADWCRM
uniref:Putative secreted protein n=1 Tax=Anopheles marajoara TaxID=58244 RepID=A0A2M4CE77_9DIPT